MRLLAASIALAAGCGGAAGTTSLGSTGTTTPTATAAPTATPTATTTPTAAPISTSFFFDDAPAPPARFETRRIGGGEGAGARWAGHPIDLDLRGADIRDVCRLIADVGRVNIVVSDEVTGSVTVKMKGVPWDQALDVVLRAKGYVAERDGRMILVTRPR